MSQLPRYISNEDMQDSSVPSAQPGAEPSAMRGVRENPSGSVVYFDPRTDTSPYAAKPKRKKGGSAPRKKTAPSNRLNVSGAEQFVPADTSPYASPDRSPYAAPDHSPYANPGATGVQTASVIRGASRRNSALHIVSDDPGEISRLAEDQLRSGVGTPARSDARTPGQTSGQAAGQAAERNAGRAASQPAGQAASFRPEAVRPEANRPESARPEETRAARTGRTPGERAAGMPGSQNASQPYAANIPSFLVNQQRDAATAPRAAAPRTATRTATREDRRSAGAGPDATASVSAPAAAGATSASASAATAGATAANATVAASATASAPAVSPADSDDYKSRPSARPVKAVVVDDRPLSERVWRALLVGVTVLSSIAVMIVMLYFPAQELYLNYRQQERLQSELDAVLARNQQMQDRVDSLQTAEGIQDEARLYHNLIMPGENAVYVSGTDYAAASTAIPADIPRGSGTSTSTWSTDLLDRVFGVTNTATATSTEVATIVEATAETDTAVADPDADIVAQGDEAAQ